MGDIKSATSHIDCMTSFLQRKAKLCNKSKGWFPPTGMTNKQENETGKAVRVAQADSFPLHLKVYI